MVKKVDRYKTSIWISRKVHNQFIEACELAGRKSCDVLEPLEKAFVWMVRRSKIKDERPCPFAPLNITIETMKLESLYEKRGPKSGEIKCLKTGDYVERAYCLSSCRHGGSNTIHRRAGRKYELCTQYSNQ